MVLNYIVPRMYPQINQGSAGGASVSESQEVSIVTWQQSEERSKVKDYLQRLT